MKLDFCELGDVATVSAGQSAPQGSDFFCDDGTPFIRAGSLEFLTNGGSESNCEKITDEAAKKHRLRLFPADTILFAKSGMSATLGRIYRLKESCYVVSHLAAIIPGPNVFPSYLQRWFEKHPPSRLIPNESYPSIRLSEIKTLKIPLPSLSEQKRIASILDMADAIRRKRQQAIRLVDEFLRSVFLDMFGDPITNPKKWPLRLMVDIGLLQRGKSKHRPRNDPILLGGKYPLIQTGDVANSDHFIRHFNQTYSEFGLKQSKLWPANTLCITIAANIADTAILTFDACFPDSIVGFKPYSIVKTEYIHMWLTFYQNILREKAPESAQKNINLQILSKLQAPIPPIEFQKEFVEIFYSAEMIKNKMRKSANIALNSYNSLTQRAFRGEL
jgi:type I restriction enzyme, S subunit